MEDSLSGRSFLVNTGVAFSIFPHCSTDRPEDLTITAAHRNPIKTWGTQALPLRFGTRWFMWDFVLASVDRPILGANFFHHHDLVVDLCSHCLLHLPSNQTIPAVGRPPMSPKALATLISAPAQYQDLPGEYPEIFDVMADTLSCPMTTTQTTPTIMTPKHFSNNAEPTLPDLPPPLHGIGLIDWADFAV